MAALQIKQFPDELLAQLKAAAAIQRMTLAEFVTQSLAAAVAGAEPRTEGRHRAGHGARQ
jgi:hypothetical protein